MFSLISSQTTIDMVGETLVHTEKPADGKGKTPHYTWELLPDNNVKIVRI